MHVFLCQQLCDIYICVFPKTAGCTVYIRVIESFSIAGEGTISNVDYQ